LFAELERKRKALLQKPAATVDAKMEWMDLERRLTQDLNATRNTLNSIRDELTSTQEELASTQDELVFTKSALTLQLEIRSRETDDAEMEDLDHKSNAGLNRARSENDSLRRKLDQSEQDALKLAATIERLEDKVKDSKKIESDYNKLKLKSTKLEAQLKQLQDALDRTRSSHKTVSSQRDITQNSENVKGS